MNVRILPSLRWLTLGLTFLCLSGFSSLWAQTEIDGIYYNLDADALTAEVTSGSQKYTGEITIPETVTSGDVTYRVNRIASRAFDECVDMTAIHIPHSVTTIGTYAFNKCEGLQSLTIPSSVSNIGSQVIEGCIGLTTIVVEDDNEYYDSRNNCNAIIKTSTNTLIAGGKASVIPNTVTCIGNGAFAGHENITSIHIPTSVTQIMGDAFGNCTGLTCITIPSSVTSLTGGWGNVFWGCTNLTTMYMKSQTPPKGFSGCGSLTTIYVPVGAADAYNVSPWNNYTIVEETPVTINGISYKLGDDDYTAEVVPNPDGVTKYTGSVTIPSSVTFGGAHYAVTGLGLDAFKNCTGLTNVVIPTSVTSIGESAFNGCTGLGAMIIPNSVTTIGNNAFQDCTSLATLIIPSSVTSIGASLLRGCSSLSTLYVDSSNPNYCNDGLVLYNKDKTTLWSCPASVTGEFDIPSTVQTIYTRAFLGCKGLTAINIPGSVTTINDNAFHQCSGLQTITIPNSVTSMGDYCFHQCPGLSAVTLSNQVTRLGTFCFGYCSSLTSLTIPESVTSLGYACLSYCSALSSLTIPASVTSMGDYCFYQCTGLSSLTIPASVTSLGYACLYNCSALSSLTIPASVTSIGNYCFYKCTSLSSLTIPASVTSLGDYFLYGCSALTSLTIPASVTSIGNYCFYNCTSLTSLTIPASVTSVGSYCFAGCTNMVDLYMEPTTPPTNPGHSIFGIIIGSSSQNAGVKNIYVPADENDPYNIAPWNEYNVIANTAEAIALKQLVNEVGIEGSYMPADHNDFSSHGLLKDASQLSTNKQEPTEGPIANLLDNSTGSYFHSTWSVTNTSGEKHYIQADLLKAVSKIRVKYYERNINRDCEPKTIRVMATNDAAGDWQEISLVSMPARSGNVTINLGAAYRYVRFVVEETFMGNLTNNNLYFYWSELGIFEEADELEGHVQELLQAALPSIRTGVIDSQVVTALQQVKDFKAGSLSAISLFDKFSAFKTDTDLATTQADYTRHFGHTKWQALYVPMHIAYDDISDDFVVAELNNFHQYDDDGDGTYDRTELEVLHLKPGDVIAANTPYVIRAKSAGEFTLPATDGIMRATQNNDFDCASLRRRYVFHGTYDAVSGSEMVDGHYYAFANGELRTANSTSVGLSPYRWYVRVEDRTTGEALSPAMLPAKIDIVEREEGSTTGIEAVETTDNANGDTPVYDLNGRRVGTTRTLHSLSKGVYVVGGKKIMR